MEAEAILEFDINLDQSKESSLKRISDIVEEQRKNLYKQKNIKFNVIQNGKKVKEFVYTLSKEKIEEVEKQIILHQVVSSVIKKELGSKIAQREDIINNIVENLKNDPYWYNNINKLIRALNEEK
ncbi:MAG: hypothetical protein KatS3mg068_0322 [Candidatus Sericytochromatia bacterium]|nr:MAG: hypothetical protein KatS3mg068_0322 [Candidatus Sericytochromatia bacterium]